jgi:hypothetical protein
VNGLGHDVSSSNRRAASPACGAPFLFYSFSWVRGRKLAESSPCALL